MTDTTCAVIMGFLQNQWFRNPARAAQTLSRLDDATRHEFIARALFAGCRTGRCLQETLGDLVDRILWDNASPELGSSPGTRHGADVGHIQRELLRHEPKIVVAFGRIAFKGMVLARANLPNPMAFNLFALPHPAARQPDVRERLILAAVAIREAEAPLFEKEA